MLSTDLFIFSRKGSFMKHISNNLVFHNGAFLRQQESSCFRLASNEEVCARCEFEKSFHLLLLARQTSLSSLR
jgi:hypothetical protein